MAEGKPVLDVEDTEDGLFITESSVGRVALIFDSMRPLADTNFLRLFVSSFDMATMLVRVAEIIENTYGHDEDGERSESRLPKSSGADVVDELLGLETSLRDVLDQADIEWPSHE